MDTNNSILLIDPSFDPATAITCSLLVKVGLNNFSYAIINQQTKQVNAVYDEQECENGVAKFAERLQTDGYLGLPYQEIKLAMHTENRIAIPNELYDEAQLEVHSQYFASNEDTDLYVQSNNHFGFTTIFTLPESSSNALKDFKAEKKYPQSAGLLALAQNLGPTALMLDFTVGTCSVLYVKNEQVIFQQTYEIENIEEFNYYLLLLINQLHMETKTTPIYLSGIVHQNDEKYTCLKQYFNEINFTSVADELDQQILDDMPAHYYSSLLALNQCV